MFKVLCNSVPIIQQFAGRSAKTLVDKWQVEGHLYCYKRWESFRFEF